MAASHTARVVIAGAGPVGLMLAGELRLGGADVLVLEQRDAPATESRASTLHARTMEILDSRGLLDLLGSPPRDLRGHFGGIPLDLTLPSPYAGQWKVPQTRTEELLGEWAAGLGARVLRSHRVRAVRQDGGHVEAEVAGPRGTAVVRCQYLVACDGADSTVRGLAGADFPGHDAGRLLLRADVAGIRVPDRRFERLPGGLAIAARRPDGVTRVMVHEFGSGAGEHGAGQPGPADVTAAWKRVTGEDISAGTFLWVNAFGDASRQLASYRHGRVLFAGDAAHQQLPAGGQALNLGLQDAVNLGWKLAAEVAGTAPPGLLDSYHAERHPVGQHVLSNIAAQAMLLMDGPEIEPLRALLGELIELPEVRARLAAMICGLDIRYDTASGNTASGNTASGNTARDHQGGQGRELEGRRLPVARLAADGVTRSTAELLRGGRGLLLIAGGDPAGELRALAAPWAGRVAVTAAAPLPGTGAGTGAEALPAIAMLARPDGYVAWAGTSPAGLRDALRRWFGAARDAAAARQLPSTQPQEA